MGRRRTNKENRGLPARWRKRGPSYYYQVPEAKRHLWDGRTEFKLGSTLTEAYRTWADRMENAGRVRTFGDLLDRYAMEVTPTKAPKTQRSDVASFARLKGTSFIGAELSAIKPAHVYQYRDRVGQSSKWNANKDVAIISHAFSMAVEWGLIDRNPIKGQVKKLSMQSRDRYVEDWELDEFLKVASPLVRCYLSMKLMTGLRKGDLLGIKLTDLQADGIHIQASKTTKKMIIEWTPELSQAVSAVKQLRGKVSSVWLFCTRRGQPYKKPDGDTSGFDSIWQRQMRKAMDETGLTERFTEHDLRAKVASDTDLDHAVSLLQHGKDDITRKVYRRKGQVVKPAKWTQNK